MMFLINSLVSVSSELLIFIDVSIIKMTSRTVGHSGEKLLLKN